MRALKQRWRLLLAGAGILAIALLVVGAVRSVNGVRLAQDASATARDLEPRLVALKDGAVLDPASLHGVVADLGGKIDRARSDLTPFLQVSPLFGWVPKVGPRLRNAGDMLDLADNLVEASRDLLAAGDLAAGATPPAGPGLLQGSQVSGAALRAIAQGQTLYQSSLDRLGKVRAILGRLDERDLAQEYRGLMAAARRLTPELETFARAGLGASQLWESFFGFRGPRTYLLVAQNSDELRATGGFIPGAWVLTFDQGNIARLEFVDTTSVDNLKAQFPLPPEGLLQGIWAGAWLFRDAGWFPDYRTSAQAMERIFRLGKDIEFDGVISVDQFAVQDLLEALGPIKPAGDDQELDSRSYLRVLERQTDVAGHAYIDAVLQGLLERLRSRGSRNDTVALLGALNRSLHEKHMLLFFKEPALQRLAQDNGWDGAVQDHNGDYLLVVDSNVGFNKVNRSIAERVSYEVTLALDATAAARLELSYTNRSQGLPRSACGLQAAGQGGSTYEEQKNACYWNYLRVYTPEGTSLQGASPLVMPQGALYRRLGYNDIEETRRSYTESGKTAFAGFFTVDIGESRNVALAYDLPPGVVGRSGDRLTYELLVQKQAGTLETPIRVTVNLPAGYRLRESSLAPSRLDGRAVVYDLGLSADTRLGLVLERSAGVANPRFVDQDRQAPPVDFNRAVTASVSITVEPGAAALEIAQVQVSPLEAVATPGQQVLFTAVAFDSQGAIVPGARFRWETANSLAGTITPAGLFTASPRVGNYADAVQVTAASPGGTVAATASVSVISPSPDDTRLLDFVVPYPSSIAVQPGQVVGLGAVGWDARGRFVQGVRYRWAMARTDAGAVDGIGFFTASRKPGQYDNAIEVTAVQQGPDGPLERRASISIRVTEAVQRGVLRQAAVIPRAVVASPGQRIELIPAAFDETGQKAPGVSFAWRVSQAGAGSFDRSGSFTAGRAPGRYPSAIELTATQAAPGAPVQERVAVGVTVDVIIEAPRAPALLSAGVVVPGAVTLAPGQRLLFFATGLTRDGQAVPTRATWTVADDRAGSVDSNGVFTAGNTPGSYQDAVKVTLVQEAGGRSTSVEAFATVNIHGPLARLEVRPPDVTLAAGKSARLRAVGFDANGLEVLLILVRWRVENPLAGTIDSLGVFTAGAAPGRYPDAIKVAGVEIERR